MNLVAHCDTVTTTCSCKVGEGECWIFIMKMGSPGGFPQGPMTAAAVRHRQSSCLVTSTQSFWPRGQEDGFHIYIWHHREIKTKPRCGSDYSVDCNSCRHSHVAFWKVCHFGWPQLRESCLCCRRRFLIAFHLHNVTALVPNATWLSATEDLRFHSRRV